MHEYFTKSTTLCQNLCKFLALEEFGSLYMYKMLQNIVILSTLIACGAAENGQGRSGAENGNGNERVQRNFDSEKMPAQMRDQMFRSRGAVQYTYANAASLLAQKKLPATHRLIPNLLQDNDNNVIMPNLLPNPSISCGNENDENVSILARIKKCRDIQVDELALKWLGKTQGISGEGDWQLIVNSSFIENNKNVNKQVWHDISTNHLWSDVLVDYSWFEASGVDSNFEDRPCQAKSDAPRHELGRIPPAIVNWRLPNRNEFLQADLNGSRFVLPNKDQFVWTASYAGNNQAWAINVATGELALRSAYDKLPVRCLGVIVK
jgi:hypothetical protein